MHSTNLLDRCMLYTGHKDRKKMSRKCACVFVGFQVLNWGQEAHPSFFYLTLSKSFDHQYRMERPRPAVLQPACCYSQACSTPYLSILRLLAPSLLSAASTSAERQNRTCSKINTNRLAKCLVAKLVTWPWPWPRPNGDLCPRKRGASAV